MVVAWRVWHRAGQLSWRVCSSRDDMVFFYCLTSRSFYEMIRCLALTVSMATDIDREFFFSNAAVAPDIESTKPHMDPGDLVFIHSNAHTIVELARFPAPSFCLS
jgi:hypothetical protein